MTHTPKIRNSRAPRVALALALGAFGALSVVTAEAAVNKKVQRACLSDYKRLCPAYRFNSPQMRACMEAKASEISSVCVNALIDSGEVDRRYRR